MLQRNTYSLSSHTCIYDHGEVLSGMARKQVFQISEGLAASISTKRLSPSRGGFSNPITSDRVQTRLR